MSLSHIWRRQSAHQGCLRVTDYYNEHASLGVLVEIGRTNNNINGHIGLHIELTCMFKLIQMHSGYRLLSCVSTYDGLWICGLWICDIQIIISFTSSIAAFLYIYIEIMALSIGRKAEQLLSLQPFLNNRYNSHLDLYFRAG